MTVIDMVMLKEVRHCFVMFRVCWWILWTTVQQCLSLLWWNWSLWSSDGQLWVWLFSWLDHRQLSDRSAYGLWFYLIGFAYFSW